MGEMMNKFQMVLVTAACMSLLSGCQTMSASECQVADWSKLGQQDGNAGRQDMLAQRIESCQKNAVAVSPTAPMLYRSGYAEGLSYYCQPRRILNEALAGRAHVDVCPLAAQGSLRVYADAGARVYQAQQRVDQLRQERDRLNRELQDKKTTDTRAREIANRQYQLSHELDNAFYDLRQAQGVVDRL